MTLSSSYRALVSDGKDSVQVAITGTGDGIAVIDLRKNHGIEVPMAPPIATTRMSLTDRETIVVHESVWVFGNRQASDAIIAAERQPVTTSDQISAEEADP
jgi:hypothetical protein